MEAIIDKADADGNKIDAVLAENDSTALGVVGALTAKSYGYPAAQRPGRRRGQPEQRRPGQPVRRRLEERQRARQGRRRGRARSSAQGTAMRRACRSRTVCVDAERRSDRRPDRRSDFTTPGGNTVKSIILKPTPITAGEPATGRSTRGWITKDQLCEGVDRPTARRPPASDGRRPLRVASTCAPRIPAGRRSLSSRQQEGRRDERGRCDTGYPVRRSRPRGRRSASSLAQTEIDLRLFGMLVALRRHPARRSTS